MSVRGIVTESQEEVMGINDRKQLAEAERALQRRKVEALMAERLMQVASFLGACPETDHVTQVRL